MCLVGNSVSERVAWTVYEWGIKARSGHGCPSINEVGQSDAADLSAAPPRRGGANVPARKQSKTGPVH